MRIPLQAVYEGHWINLKGDKYADPDGRKPAFAIPLYVFLAHGGGPGNDDWSRVWDSEIFGTWDSEKEEERGITLIVSPKSGDRATLLYFPNDQHEVEVEDRDED